MATERFYQRNRVAVADNTNIMTAGRRARRSAGHLADREMAHFDREVILSGACTPRAGAPTVPSR